MRNKCGLHADWVSCQSCTPTASFKLVTMLLGWKPASIFCLPIWKPASSAAFSLGEIAPDSKWVSSE